MKKNQKNTKNTKFDKKIEKVDPSKVFDYKDIESLSKFVTERGKIIPRSRTNLTARQQRDLTRSIKRARMLALMPFSN